MNSDNLNEFFERRPTFEEAYLLASSKNLKSLTQIATKIRDRGHGNIISYSRKIFIPLTKLCRDVCHYCTFSRDPLQTQQS